MKDQLNFDNIPLNAIFSDNTSENQAVYLEHLVPIEYPVLEFEQLILVSDASIEASEQNDLARSDLLLTEVDEQNVLEKIDVLVKIFSYLDSNTLAILSRVNHAFLSATKDNGLWKALLKRDFKREITHSNHSDLKKLYGEIYSDEYKGLDKNQKYNFSLAKNRDYVELINRHIDVTAKDKHSTTIMDVIMEDGKNYYPNQPTLDHMFMCFLLSKVFNDNKETENKENIHETILCKAVWYKQPINMLKLLTLQGASASGKWVHKTPLHCAAFNNDVAATNFLIEQGANVNEMGSLGATPLFVAAATNRQDVLKKLLSLNADINIPLQENHHIISNRSDITLCIGDTPLSVAIKYRHLNIAKTLLEKKADPYYVVNNLNALHLAAKLGRFAVVKLLIEKGIDINRPSPCGAPAIFFAAVNNHLEIVSYLLAHKADTTLALTIKNDDHIKYNVDVGDTILHIAVKMRSSDLINRLLISNVDINMKDKLGRSPLHLAVLSGFCDIAEQLLSFYRVDMAEVNACDHAGATPLLLATELGNMKMVAILLRHRADLTIALHTITDYHELFNTKLYDNPLYVSLRIQNKAIFTKLLETNNKEKNIDSIALALAAEDSIITHNESHFEKLLVMSRANDIKNIALFIAAEKGLIEEAKLLLASDTEINYINESGATPLFFAVINKYDKMVQMLLENGANPNIKLIKVDPFFKKANATVGDTPLHIAVRNKDKACIHELLKNNADVEAKNNNKQTPIQLAPPKSRCADELALVVYLKKVHRRPDHHHKKKISLFEHELAKFGAPAKCKKELANATYNFLFAGGIEPKLKDHKEAKNGELLEICTQLGIR